MQTIPAGEGGGSITKVVTGVIVPFRIKIRGLGTTGEESKDEPKNDCGKATTNGV